MSAASSQGAATACVGERDSVCFVILMPQEQSGLFGMYRDGVVGARQGAPLPDLDGV